MSDSETEINKKPQSNNGFLEKGTHLVSDSKNHSLEYKITGNLIGVSVVTNKDGGKFDVIIDDKKVKTIDTYSAMNIERYFLVDNQLEDREHTVKIIPTEAKRKASTDNIVRISGVITSKGK